MHRVLSPIKGALLLLSIPLYHSTSSYHPSLPFFAFFYCHLRFILHLHHAFLLFFCVALQAIVRQSMARDCCRVFSLSFFLFVFSSGLCLVSCVLCLVHCVVQFVLYLCLVFCASCLESCVLCLVLCLACFFSCVLSCFVI